MEQDKFLYLLSDFALFMNKSHGEGAANRDEYTFQLLIFEQCDMMHCKRNKQTKKPEIQRPIFKLGRRPKKTFLQRRQKHRQIGT